MYSSLKPWMNLPAQIKPFLKRDGTGTKIYADPVAIKCYAEGKVQVVTDSNGAEVVSTSQLYVDGPTEVSVLDCVIFEGVEKSIRNITTYYRNGLPDLKVVYL